MPVVSLKWWPRELPYKTYAHEMVVAVIGANGGIGRRLLPRLDDAGDPIGIVRSEDQFDGVPEPGLAAPLTDGIEPVLGADDAEGLVAGVVQAGEEAAPNAAMGADDGNNHLVRVGLVRKFAWQPF